MTERNRDELGFHPSKPVHVEYDAPDLSSNGGLVAIRALDDELGLTSSLAELVPDERDQWRVLHGRSEQVRQRVFQIVAGYEDQNDADFLRHDPALITACGGSPGNPEEAALSSQSSLSRLENDVGPAAIKQMLLWCEERYAKSKKDAEIVILDIDPTDFRTYGAQQMALFHGYYDNKILYPFIIFDGQTGEIVTAVLRGGRAGGTRGAKFVLDRVIRRIKAHNPGCMIVVRGDAAFGSGRIMRRLDRLEAEFDDVYYLFGIGKNAVLKRKLKSKLEVAEQKAAAFGGTARVLTELEYKARKWYFSRLVIGKAEVTEKGPNPRFVITNIDGFEPRVIYHAYCQRGCAELMIKDFKNAMKAARMSCSSFWANFFRLILHVVAYNLMLELRRRIALHDEELGCAQFDTIRLHLLKVAVIVTESVRRIRFQLPASFPRRALFGALLRSIGPPPS